MSRAMQTPQIWLEISPRRHYTLRKGYRLTVTELVGMNCFKWHVSKGGVRVRSGVRNSLLGGQGASLGAVLELPDVSA